MHSPLLEQRQGQRDTRALALIAIIHAMKDARKGEQIKKSDEARGRHRVITGKRSCFQQPAAFSLPLLATAREWSDALSCLPACADVMQDTMTHRAADVGAVVDFSFMRLVNMVDIYDEEPRSGVVRKVDLANPGAADSEKGPKQVANVLKLNNNALVGIDSFSTVLVCLQLTYELPY